MNRFVPIALVGSLISLAFAIFATLPGYRVAPVFLIPAIWGPVFLRHKLNLHPFHYALYVVAVLIHNLGAFGYYQKSPLGFSFDILVHFYFGFAAAFIVRRFFATYLAIPTWAVATLTVLVVMGGGAIHELMEYSTYLILGEERGMLKPKTSYFFDTQRDLLDNFLGVLLAMAIIGLHGLFNRRSASRPHLEPVHA